MGRGEGEGRVENESDSEQKGGEKEVGDGRGGDTTCWIFPDTVASTHGRHLLDRTAISTWRSGLCLPRTQCGSPAAGPTPPLSTSLMPWWSAREWTISRGPSRSSVSVHGSSLSGKAPHVIPRRCRQARHPRLQEASVAFPEPTAPSAPSPSCPSCLQQRPPSLHLLR